MRTIENVVRLETLSLSLSTLIRVFSREKLDTPDAGHFPASAPAREEADMVVAPRREKKRSAGAFLSDFFSAGHCILWPFYSQWRRRQRARECKFQHFIILMSTRTSPPSLAQLINGRRTVGLADWRVGSAQLFCSRRPSSCNLNCRGGGGGSSS